MKSKSRRLTRPSCNVEEGTERTLQARCRLHAQVERLQSRVQRFWKLKSCCLSLQQRLRWPVNHWAQNTGEHQASEVDAFNAAHELPPCGRDHNPRAFQSQHSGTVLFALTIRCPTAAWCCRGLLFAAVCSCSTFCSQVWQIGVAQGTQQSIVQALLSHFRTQSLVMLQRRVCRRAVGICGLQCCVRKGLVKENMWSGSVAAGVLKSGMPRLACGIWLCISGDE